MYKAMNAQDYRKFFSLPDDYQVEGFLSYGAWDEDKHRNKIIKTLKDLQAEFTTQTYEGFLSRVLEIKIKDKNYWFVVMYGGALLSEYVHLACLFGSKKNIHIGSCGGLYPEMNSLDLIIPTFSHGDESTTRCYERDSKDSKHYSNEELSKQLEENGANKYPLHKAPLVTNQAMMGETFEDVKEWSDSGYYGVEMETATVFAISKHFNVPAAALVYVTDNLIKGQTVGDESHVLQKEEREVIKNDVYRIGLTTLLN